MIQPVFFLYCLELVQKAKQKKRLWHAVPALVFTAALREQRDRRSQFLSRNHIAQFIYLLRPRGERKGSAEPIPLAGGSFYYGPAGAQGIGVANSSPAT